LRNIGMFSLKGDSGACPSLQCTVNNHFTLSMRQEPPPKGEALLSKNKKNTRG